MAEPSGFNEVSDTLKFSVELRPVSLIFWALDELLEIDLKVLQLILLDILNLHLNFFDVVSDSARVNNFLVAVVNHVFFALRQFGFPVSQGVHFTLHLVNVGHQRCLEVLNEPLLVLLLVRANFLHFVDEVDVDATQALVFAELVYAAHALFFAVLGGLLVAGKKEVA